MTETLTLTLNREQKFEKFWDPIKESPVLALAQSAENWKFDYDFGVRLKSFAWDTNLEFTLMILCKIVAERGLPFSVDGVSIKWEDGVFTRHLTLSSKADDSKFHILVKIPELKKGEKTVSMVFQLPSHISMSQTERETFFK